MLIIAEGLPCSSSHFFFIVSHQWIVHKLKENMSIQQEVVYSLSNQSVHIYHVSIVLLTDTVHRYSTHTFSKYFVYLLIVCRPKKKDGKRVKEMAIVINTFVWLSHVCKCAFHLPTDDEQGCSNWMQERKRWYCVHVFVPADMFTYILVISGQEVAVKMKMVRLELSV